MIILNEYSKWLEVNGKSKHTIEQYSQQIRDFLSKIKLEDISEETIITYLLELKEKYSPKTVNLYRTAIKSFLDYLKKDIPMPKQLKVAQRLPEFITLKYFEENVISIIDLVFENPLKIQTVMYFMFFSGLRVGEIPLLQRKDFNLKERTAKMFSPKTKKERIIFYNKKARNLLEMYFSTTPESKNAFNTQTSTIKGYFNTLKPYLKDINFHPHLLRHCVSKDTEILTLEGWKKYSELKIGEKVFSYNIKKNKIELTPLINISKYSYKNKLYNIKNNYLDILMTPEHKHIFKVAKEKQLKYKRWTEWQSWTLKTIKELEKEPNKRLIKTLLSGKYQGKKSIGIEKAFILGLLMTDGHISNRKCPDITISQSLSANPKKCKIIEKILKNSNLSFTKNIQKPKINNFSRNKHQIIVFRILKKSHNWIFNYLTKKNIPILKNILKLKQEELEAIFQGLMLGDGNRKSEFTDQNIHTIQLIQTLAILTNKRVLCKWSPLENKFRTYISYKNSCNILLKDIKKVDYEGIVWCPQTKNRTWIGRRNGKVFITGNSFANYFLVKGGDIYTLKELLGHASIQSTMRYAGLSQDQLKKKYDEFIK